MRAVVDARWNVNVVNAIGSMSQETGHKLCSITLPIWSKCSFLFAMEGRNTSSNNLWQRARVSSTVPVQRLNLKQRINLVIKVKIKKISKNTVNYLFPLPNKIVRFCYILLLLFSKRTSRYKLVVHPEHVSDDPPQMHNTFQFVMSDFYS